jgi:hypothetical protein
VVPYKPRQGLTDIAGGDVLFFGKQIGMHLDIVRVEASLVLPTSHLADSNEGAASQSATYLRELPLLCAGVQSSVPSDSS